MSELKVHASLCDTEPMVQIEDLRKAFSERLKTALVANNAKMWGVGARLAKFTGVTPKAASKWLNGEAMPSGLHMMALAAGLQVRLEWLEYGIGEMRAVTYPGHLLDGDSSKLVTVESMDEGVLLLPPEASLDSSNVEPGPPIVSSTRRIDIVGTAQLGPEGYWAGLDQSAGWVETYSRDQDAYALRLKGDSMAPAIRSGWVAVCEPNHRLVAGEYVMVTTKDGQSMVKELLFEAEEGVSLMSINTAYGERRSIAWEDIETIHYVGAILGPSKVLGRI